MNEKYKLYRESVVNAFHDVFVFNDKNELPEVISIEELIQKPGRKRKILYATLKLLDRILPESTRNHLSLIKYKNLPIDPNLCSIEILDKGYVNRVYCIYREKSDVPSHVLLLEKKPYNSMEEAELEARRLQSNFKTYSELFSSIKDFIPQENHVVYKNYQDKPAIMCIRRFVNGPINDIFDDFSKEELLEITKRNKDFNKQLSEFINISDNNTDVIIGGMLDLLGSKNLSVVGEYGNEKPVLIEAHSINSYSRFVIDTELFRNRIANRLEYLREIVTSSNKI